MQLAECLPGMHEALGSTPSTRQNGCGGAHLWSSIQEVEAGGLEVQSYLQPTREFKASLGYMRLFYKKKKKI